MGEMNRLQNPIEVICPGCGEYVEIDDVDVSVTIWGTDDGRGKTDGVFDHTCGECGKVFNLICHLNIGVQYA